MPGRASTETAESDPPVPAGEAPLRNAVPIVFSRTPLPWIGGGVCAFRVARPRRSRASVPHRPGRVLVRATRRDQGTVTRHNPGMRTTALALLVVIPAMTGCVVAIGNRGMEEPARSTSAPVASPAEPRAALIHHVVLIRLNDPDDLAAVTADCDRLLPSIPGVHQYWRGTHLDTGRPNVIGDYSLALHVAFTDREAYRAYLAHPNHVELADRWRAEGTMLIYDAWDPG